MIWVLFLALDKIKSFYRLFAWQIRKWEICAFYCHFLNLFFPNNHWFHLTYSKQMFTVRWGIMVKIICNIWTLKRIKHHPSCRDILILVKSIFSLLLFSVFCSFFNCLTYFYFTDFDIFHLQAWIPNECQTEAESEQKKIIHNELSEKIAKLTPEVFQNNQSFAFKNISWAF